MSGEISKKKMLQFFDDFTLFSAMGKIDIFDPVLKNLVSLHRADFMLDEKTLNIQINLSPEDCFAEQNTAESNRVVIAVDGGAACVKSKPKGITVAIKDYDTDGCPSNDLMSDDDGTYSEQIYE
ncbi:MAG: hypothetical protein PHN44_09340 [Candidatus Marinimicrobia bacterium]|jgi:hypothetical protein|nr:hypothetical protein [Candidatus Neomarinimicrobiota bacterium]